MLRFIIIMLIMVSSLFAQTTYYVDADASDGGDGSYASPWNDVDDVNGYSGFNRGDIVYWQRGDTFTKAGGDYSGSFMLKFPVDGLIYDAYGTGDPPIFDGENRWHHVIGSWASIAKNAWKLKNVTVKSPQNIDGANCLNVTSSDSIEIYNCVLDADSAEFALYIEGSDYYKLTYSTLKNATGPHPKDSTNTADWLEPLHCMYSNGCSNITVEHNHFYNARTGGFKTNVNVAWNDSIIIRYNWFEGCGAPIALFGVSNSLIAYNIVITNYDVEHLAGISNRGYFDAITFGNGDKTSNNIKIYNNTFITSDSTNNCVVVRAAYPIGSNIDFKNNLFYQAYKDKDYYNWQQNNVNSTAMNYDYNLWYVDGGNVGQGWYHNGTTYSTWSSWQTAGNDANGKWAEPTFVDFTWQEYPITNNNLTPLSTSPAVNAGTAVTDFKGNTLNIDYYGNPIVSAPDIGAIEYQIDTSSTPDKALYLRGKVKVVGSGSYAEDIAFRDSMVVVSSNLNDTTWNIDKYLYFANHGLSVGSAALVDTTGSIRYANDTTRLSCIGTAGIIVTNNHLQTSGIVEFSSHWLVKGRLYYFSSTDGNWSITPPTTSGYIKRIAAQAISDSTAVLNPSQGYGIIP